MYSLEELFFSFVIAIIFIFIFKLQRQLFKENYWATGDILSDIEEAPSLKLVLIRFFIILIFGLVLSFFVLPKVIIFGLTLGSFLIVWPVFLNDEHVKEELLDKKLVLRSLLALFVVLTYATVNLSIVAFNLINEVILIYIQDFNFDRIVNLIADSLLWAFFIFILGKTSKHMRKNLTKKVTLTQNISSLSQDEIDSSYIESAATKEHNENEKKNTTVDKKVSYFKHKVRLNKKNIDKRIYLVEKYAGIYNLDRNEMYGILILEHVNRGSRITKIAEKTIVNFCIQKAITLDLSIGIAQIKISTAKKFYPNTDSKLIAKKLLVDEFNIHLCAQIISNYYVSPNKDNKLLGLVKEYTTGNKDSNDNISIIIYYILLQWIVEKSL